MTDQNGPLAGREICTSGHAPIAHNQPVCPACRAEAQRDRLVEAVREMPCGFDDLEGEFKHTEKQRAEPFTSDCPRCKALREVVE